MFMFEKVQCVSVNKRNGHQLLVHMFILYLKDVVTLLNPRSESWRMFLGKWQKRSQSRM